MPRSRPRSSDAAFAAIDTRVLDVRDAAAVQALLASLDTLDVLVNCAGTIRRGGAEHDPAVFAEVLDINLTGTMRVCAAARTKLAARQGHAGMLVECDTCHVTPRTTSMGPHGMHPVGQQWVIDHHDAASPSATACRPCHGTDYRGTVLSASQADRTLSTRYGAKYFWDGFRVGCYTCHMGPSSDDTNPNRPPVATPTSASTTEGSSVAVNLVATDADHNPVTLRIVSQPVHGSAALAGTVAVYFPDPGYVGADSLTFAASDGSTDSNLASVSLTVGLSPCTLVCDGSAPTEAAVAAWVGFQGSAVASGCGAPVSYEWSFGDGAGSTASMTGHAYATADTFRWGLTARAGTATCARSGLIRTTAAPLRVPYLLAPLRVATSSRGRDLTLTWDADNCPSGGYHLLHGYGSGLPSWTVSGGSCALGGGGSYAWNSTPDPAVDPSRLLWFLVAGDDGVATEGSWGTTSSGLERGGAGASGVCGMTVKETGGYCAAP